MSGQGASVQHTGAGVYQVMVTARWMRWCGQSRAAGDCRRHISAWSHRR